MTTQSFQQIFADGIKEIGFGAGALRVDFFTLGLPTAPGEPPQAEVNLRVVMTPQAFAEAVAVMQGMVDKLRESGLVPPEAPRPVSPNF